MPVPVARVARARWSALFTDAVVVSSSSATSTHRPSEHVAEHERGSLLGGKQLERADEREANGVTLRGNLGRVAIEIDHVGVRDSVRSSGRPGARR